MRRSHLERQVLETIQAVRFAVPDYGRRPLTTAEVQHAASVFNLEIVRTATQTPAQLSAPIGGRHYLGLADWLPTPVTKYITLHEIAHVLRGDVAEPTVMLFTGAYPEFEVACDLFALTGVMDPVDLEHGRDWAEARIRQLVPLDNYGWQKYRIPELAPKVVRMRKLIEEWLE